MNNQGNDCILSSFCFFRFVFFICSFSFFYSLTIYVFCQGNDYNGNIWEITISKMIVGEILIWLNFLVRYSFGYFLYWSGFKQKKKRLNNEKDLIEER